MPQPGGQYMPPYPMGGYGDPGHAAPPAGFQVGYQSGPDHTVMYQPGPTTSPSHHGTHIVKYISKWLLTNECSC